jgi:Helix-loop-helix DNA-binding domain
MYNGFTDSPFTQADPLEQVPSTIGACDSFSPEDFAILMSGDPEEQINSQIIDSWPTSPEDISPSQTSVNKMFSPFPTPFSNQTVNPQVTHDYFPLTGTTYQQHTQHDINDFTDEPLFGTSTTTTMDFEPPPSTGPIRRRGSETSNHANRLNHLRPRTKRLSQSQIAASMVPETPEPSTFNNSNRRQAHNLVERKYRDTLNAELERLRRTIPHIRDLESETPDGRPRPSKATVLAAATEYIKKLEIDVEDLREENMQLREDAGLPKTRKRGSA